jgi:hypothetical protein
VAIDAKATFAVGLDTEGVVKPGDEAAQVLERLKTKIHADVAALAQMGAAMKNLKGGSSINIAAFKDLTEKIAKQKQGIAGAQADYIRLGGRLGDLGKKAVAGKGGLSSLSEAAGAAGGPLGRLLGGASRLGTMFGAGSLAALGLAAALVIFGVAVAAATVKLIGFALASAGAHRSELLQLQGLMTVRNWYAIAAGKAGDLQDAIDRVSDSSALGRDKILEYAKGLYNMGLRGANLSDALEGTAIKASVQGTEFASAFMGMAVGANMAGGSVKRLSDDVRARLGGIAKAQALALDVQIAKLHENFARLFEGIHIEGFLSALSEVLSIFSQTTYTGRALKQILEIVFTPLSRAVEVLGPIMKRFFQGMIIAGLDFLIFVFKIRNYFRDTFGDVSLFKGVDWLKVSLTIGKIAIWALVAGIVALGLAVAFLALPFVAFFGIIVGLYNLIFNIKWGELGSNIVKGIAEGITAGVQWVTDAISGLATKAKNAFTSLLGIHSRSRVFFEYGGFVTQGLVQGVDKGRPQVGRSIGNMLDEPGKATAGTAAAGKGGASSTSSAVNVEIRELHYHSSGKGQHQADADDFVAKLTQSLEGVGIHMGAA